MSDGCALRSCASGSTQKSLIFQWFLRRDTGPNPDGATWHSGTLRLTQKSLEFQWFLRRDTSANPDGITLRSGTSRSTQKSLIFQWFLRRDTGDNPDGTTWRSGVSRVTQKSLVFQCFLRRNTGTTPHGTTLHSGTSVMTQIHDKGGGILCGQGVSQLVHVVFHGPAKELGLAPARDSDPITETLSKERPASAAAGTRAAVIRPRRCQLSGEQTQSAFPGRPRRGRPLRLFISQTKHGAETGMKRIEKRTGVSLSF